MSTISNRRLQFMTTAALGIMLLAITGCLITGDTTETRTGITVPESTFTQIEVGKTTSGWVKATLGEPTTRSVTDGSEVWTYRYTERKDSSAAVFLIFGGHNSTETVHAAFVEFKDGIVTKKWRADA
jgi:hypothetical protein